MYACKAHDLNESSEAGARVGRNELCNGMWHPHMLQQGGGDNDTAYGTPTCINQTLVYIRLCIAPRDCHASAEALEEPLAIDETVPAACAPSAVRGGMVSFFYLVPSIHIYGTRKGGARHH